MSEVFVIGSDRYYDGNGDLSGTSDLLDKIETANLRYKVVKIASIANRWQEALPDGHVKSACSPIEACLLAKQFFKENVCDVVVLYGKDFIKTEWKHKKEERNRLMEGYGPGENPLTGYTKVSLQYMKKNNLNIDVLLKLSEKIFENHLRVRQRRQANFQRPDDRRFKLITETFRAVDCANPSVDFEGRIIFARSEALEKLGFSLNASIKVVGVDLQCSGEDGPRGIPDLISYEHLTKAYLNACEQADINFFELFQKQEALLEIYTCFPIVVIAFLMASRMVSSHDEIEKFLERYPLTYTGGLNLNKAPWNCTTTNHIIDGLELLKKGKEKYLGVHGNGSLGNKQGFIIFKKG